ncbi:GIY-YIG nuclease family protein [Mesorhizobium sp. INR15]|uniref:GIY-YIG nuclease family protein n=1 Tax=Mesorhizobium sp. INR15 TaxID=2654248 RepID=UPI00189655CA
MTIGIYCIRNTVDGKLYIGKSKRIEQRWARHRRAPANRYLARAIKKHGISVFSFEILEKFDTLDPILLADREAHWMGYYKSCERSFGYNLRLDSSAQVIFSDETKARMAVAARMKAPPSDETRAKISAATKESCTRSDVIARRSAAHRTAHARPGDKARRVAALKAAYSSDEAREAMSLARKAEWARPELRARRLASLKATRATPESRAKTSAASTAVHARRRAQKALAIWLLAP